MINKHISLKDLAKELGVSISTVSRALKNHPDISNELKQKVKALALEKNYSPNPLAMGLLKQQTRMIGVIIPDLVTHFYSSIISGIETVAKENGYFILISSSNESMEKERESIQNLLQIRVEGLIVCLSQETDDYSHFGKLIEEDIPLVFFDRICFQGQVPCVIANNQQAATQITCHFHEQGYRRIAFINGPGHLEISRERLQGYLDGLKSCNLPYDPSLITDCDLSLPSARQAMSRLLELAEPPDAVFGINDTVAFAAMKVIKEHHLKIPEDIGLVGFTDEFHATVVEPQLTSVTHPTFEMGRTAAKLFFERIRSGQCDKTIQLKTQLVVRDSSVRKK